MIEYIGSQWLLNSTFLEAEAVDFKLQPKVVPLGAFQKSLPYLKLRGGRKVLVINNKRLSLLSHKAISGSED